MADGSPFPNDPSGNPAGLIVHRDGSVLHQTPHAADLLPGKTPSTSLAERLNTRDAARFNRQIEALERDPDKPVQLIANPRGAGAPVFLSTRRVIWRGEVALATIVERWTLGEAAVADGGNSDALMRRLPESLSSAADTIGAEVERTGRQSGDAAASDTLADQARALRVLSRRLIAWRASLTGAATNGSRLMPTAILRDVLEDVAAARGIALSVDGPWPTGEFWSSEETVNTALDHVLEALGAVATSSAVSVRCAPSADQHDALDLCLAVDALGLPAVAWNLPLVRFSGLVGGRPPIGLAQALGMDIAARLLANMKGALSLSFEDDRRAAATVTLAYRDDAASRTGAARAASGQKAASSPAILIAEDNAISRDLAVMTATRRGYRVTSARDGVEALEKMAGGAFDLVLMDLRMPRMDGFQATREIKRRWPDQRIIAVSATEVSVADKPEFDGFLAKPINWNAVAAYLDPALG